MYKHKIYNLQVGEKHMINIKLLNLVIKIYNEKNIFAHVKQGLF
jgi:hypothetical protein